MNQTAITPHWTSRIVKIVFHHLDGSTSTAKLEFPIINNSTDPLELAEVYLSAWINHMVSHYLTISSYHFFFGSVASDGKVCYSMESEIEQIPLNKVYVPKYPNGKWMNPETVKKREATKRLKRANKVLSPNQRY